MHELNLLDSNVNSNGFIVNDCDIPVLSIQNTPYHNAIIIRNLPEHKSRLDILMELKKKLCDELHANIMGFFFINEPNRATGYSSVVILVRNVKKLMNAWNLNMSYSRNYCSLRMFGNWIDIVELKIAGYRIAYLLNERHRHNSYSPNNMLSFENKENLNVFSIASMLDCLVEEKELISVVVTKGKVFLTLTSLEVEEEILRTLILNFGTDFDLKICDKKIVFIKKNNNLLLNNIVININLQSRNMN